MNIELKRVDASIKDLEGLIQKKYAGRGDLDYFLNDFRIAYSFCNENLNIKFFPIVFSMGGELCAHVALIVDRRLSAGEAFFGFLEFPDSQLVFETLWSTLLDEAHTHGIATLKGPVNGSIWHQYRCIKETNGESFFKTELFCEPHLYRHLTALGPSAEVPYYSSSREPYDIVLQMIGADSLKRLAESGFSIRETKEVTMEQMKMLAEISKKVFNESWGYTELDAREFMQLYSMSKLNIHLNTLYLLYKGEQIIGFCSTSKENDETLICKTVCILPEYRGLGLGNAFAYKVHADAKTAGFEKVIYALIRDGNNMKNFSHQGAIFFRRYAAFEFKV